MIQAAMAISEFPTSASIQGGTSGICTMRKLVGELYFEFCIAISANGVLNNQENLPYDIVMSEDYVNERYDDFSRYAFMLSGSDFQFKVIAKNCTFANSVEDSPIIADN
ncbi:MAG TPA: hypothetical protein VMF90_11085 [Rhizobiaceae bacterium]|nr:hypothetical protein [Rhizobiaceae bacterium]